MPIEAAFDDKYVVANEQESRGQDSYDGNGDNGETGVGRLHGGPKDRASASGTGCDWRSLGDRDEVAFANYKIHDKESERREVQGNLSAWRLDI